MKLLKFFYISLIATLALTASLSVKVNAASPVSFASAPLAITLTNPAQGQIIITSSLLFTGQAPTGVIVTVTIQDEDYQKSFQVHEANLIINGTTTSDRKGDWVYVPSKNLVPGKYSIVAAFQNENNGSISTDKVFFTVADENGLTSWFSIPGVTLVLVIAVVIAALVFILMKLMNGRKRTFMLHTTAGDIPVREIIDEHNNVEIVPVTEPMINLGSSVQQTFVQPTVQPTVYPQPQQVFIQQPPETALPARSIQQVINEKRADVQLSSPSFLRPTNVQLVGPPLQETTNTDATVQSNPVTQPPSVPNIDSQQPTTTPIVNNVPPQI
ncbi:MAG: hypothetical protein ACMG57_02675 [Candidatus Dojkabacteria bacterium]